MVKVFYGKKGMGKTKMLIDTANELSAQRKGDIVFIDDSNDLMYDLKHEIRFINVSEFPITNDYAFIGFICGLIAQDYDIQGIFIDGLTYIIKQNIDSMEGFFSSLDKLSKEHDTEFYISINGDDVAMPEFLKEYA